MGTLEFRAIKIIPKGPFTEIPGSDTLFGAIGTAVATLFGREAVEELVEGFKAGARISSAFPFEADTYYLPKPLTVELALDGILKDLPKDERYIRMKTLRKVSYLDVENFEKALRLEPFGGASELPYRIVDVPRVSLDRVTKNSSLYFWEEIRFKPGAGLYFLYSGSDGVFRDFILPAVRYLGDTGLGGKSTWGFGLFDVEATVMRLNAPESPYTVILSSALPTKRPILWKLARKGGWSYGRRKPKLNFIAEGSVVENDPGRIEAIDLGLPHQVYVYGLTFPVPANVPEGLK
ncbi:type III-A CRISPR-associated RAMP protein Csm4 [Thermococcus sp.]|uniref:type III-A CRISPR-associated RAMP protein Csm4 n=1 Tax=Thermococcus sp. TaxID=35749 RepID=UPI002604E7C3|nr:type III-A CRISPR-associated RAMP protein Csm4 [Thermococcus sp.]